MLWIFILTGLIWLLNLLYTRYIPVRGVKCISKHKLPEKDIKVDLRDYNHSARKMIAEATPLPVAYIKRHHHTIPTDNIYVIAENSVEKNLGIRLLERYGHHVVGYTIINRNCTCKKRIAKLA